MNMEALVVNAVFQPQEGCDWSLPFRITYLDREVCVLLSIEAVPKAPWVCARATLEQMLKDRFITKIEFRVPEFMLSLDTELSETATYRRDRLWEHIEPMLRESHREVHLPVTMGSVIARRARALNIDRKVLYRTLYRYWMFGSVRNGLLPQFVKCGGRGKERKHTGPHGRPPKVVVTDLQRTSKLLTEEDKAFIRIGFALYKDNKAGTIEKAYIETLKRFYCETIGAPSFPDARPTLKPIDQIPTISHFTYWGKKAFDEIDVLRSRVGERRWAKDHRALRGRAADGLLGPAHRYEIDATIADIYLVSRYNRNWIIGRPVVYVVVDVYSRMIVGLYVGLEGPSWEGARLALLNAFDSKVEYAASLGMMITEEDWPAAHLPQEICADRAEMLGKQAESIVSGLGVTLAFPPPYRPDWKSIVERNFGTLNQLTQIHWIPGGVAARAKERGERDYRLDATLDMREFAKIMVESVLHHNRFHEYPDLLTREMIQADVVPSPQAIWNWGFDQGIAMPNEQPSELVKLHLMGKGRGSIGATGLSFEGMFYTQAAGEDFRRYARARNKGSEAVEVWFKNNDPSTIYVRDRDRGLVPFSRRQSDSKYDGMRLEEVLEMNIAYFGERAHPFRSIAPTCA